MEVNTLYIENLFQLLNNEENFNLDDYKDELIVNLYLTLLSLSNLEFSEEIYMKEKNQIDDFLRKLNNLKVKIQLKRKNEEIVKLANDLVLQYYENVHILSVYINDSAMLEEVINSLDAKKITSLIDTVTKDKMNREYLKEEIDNNRRELANLLPNSSYYINNNIIYIQNDNISKEVSMEEFIFMFGYLLNSDNYNKIYNNNLDQISHDLIITNIIKLLIVKDKKKEDIKKVVIPLILTYLLSINKDKLLELDMSEFNIENIKITELYSLANNNTLENEGSAKWRNISIPKDYLIDRIMEMVSKGMYYSKDNKFVLEKVENKVSDFKISIEEEKLVKLLNCVLELYSKNSKKNK